MGSDAAHLALFDARVQKMVRTHRRVAFAGLVVLVAGYGVFRGSAGPWLQGLAGIPLMLGLLGIAGGLWIPWRLSFAAHRMWGVYERGVVAPLYIKGGFVALVPWGDIKLVKLRRMRGTETDPQAEVFLFRFEEWKNAYGLHRIWESVLQQWFGYTPAESIGFREEILAALRQYLAANRIVVETELGDP